MFRLLKKVVILTMSLPLILGYCLLLKNQECTVRKVIIDNDYMTFPSKIKVDKCIGILILKFVYQIVLKILV